MFSPSNKHKAACDCCRRVESGALTKVPIIRFWPPRFGELPHQNPMLRRAELCAPCFDKYLKLVDSLFEV